jgi:5S rRNA maturation endonuclease (ribonuclease M5)
MLDSIGISKSSPNNQFENFKKKHKLWKTHKDNYSKLEKLFQDNQDLIEIEQKKEFLKKWKSVEGDKIYTKIKEGLDNIKNDFIEKQKEDFSLIGIGKKIEVPNQEFEEFKKNHKLWKEYSEKLSKLKTLFKSCPDPKSDIFTINNFLKKKKEYGFNEVEKLLNQFKFDFDMKNTLEEIQRQLLSTPSLIILLDPDGVLPPSSLSAAFHCDRHFAGAGPKSPKRLQESAPFLWKGSNSQIRTSSVPVCGSQN